MYAGAKDSNGNQIYPGGLAMGSENFWGLWVIGGEPGPYGGILPALMTMLAEDHIKYPYPQESIYKGSGDVNDSASFSISQQPRGVVRRIRTPVVP